MIRSPWVARPGADDERLPDAQRRWLLAGAAGAGCAAWRPVGGQVASARDAPLPLPEVPMLDGSRFHPASAGDRVLVLCWWASWCPFCALQSPWMDRLWRTQAPRGLRMPGLSIDGTPEDALAHLARHGHAFPSGFVTPDVARALPKPKGLPITMVRGRDGRVALAEAGQLFPEDVEQIARFR